MKKILLALSLIFVFNLSVFANDTFINVAERGNLEAVRKHINNGVDIEAKHTQNGRTALMIASEKGHLEIVKLLVSEGANVNAKNSNGYTALILICLNDNANKNNKSEIERILKEAGARE